MRFKIYNYFKDKDGIGVLCLMLPLTLKWILPPGLEQKLCIYWGDIYFFLPNIFLIFVPFLFPICKINALQKTLLCVWITIELIVVLLSKSPNPFINIISNFHFLFAFYIGLTRTITQKQFNLIKPIFHIMVLLLSLQVIIFSLGLVNYDFGDRGESFAGIYRIYTTVGGVNSTGPLIIIMTFFIMLSNDRYTQKIIIVTISAISVFFTVTRSAIGLMVLLFVYFFFKTIKVSKIYALYSIIGVIVLYYLGIFNPIIERNASKSTDGDMSSGRDILVENVLKDVNHNDASLFGLGIGNVYQSDEVRRSNVKMPFEGAPHNVYVLMYAEQGIIGLSLCLLILVKFLMRNYKTNKDTTVCILLILLTIFNTETAFASNSELIFVFSILFMISNSPINYRVIKT